MKQETRPLRSSDHSGNERRCMPSVSMGLFFLPTVSARNTCHLRTLNPAWTPHPLARFVQAELRVHTHTDPPAPTTPLKMPASARTASGHSHSCEYVNNTTPTCILFDLPAHRGVDDLPLLCLPKSTRSLPSRPTASRGTAQSLLASPLLR